MNVLRIDFSGRHAGSVSRQLTARLADALAESQGARVVARDYSHVLPYVGEDWIGGAYIPEADRTPAHRAALATSDRLVDELLAADTLVLGLPVYNFTAPAAFKSWIDQVARRGRTFAYSEAGPVGLIEGTHAVAVVTSGGTAVGSDIDFLTPYLRHALAFLGITDVEVVAADRMMFDEHAVARAAREIDRVARPPSPGALAA